MYHDEQTYRLKKMSEIKEQLLPNPFDHLAEINLTDDHHKSNDLEGIQRETIEENSDEPNFPFFYPLVYHNIHHQIQPVYSSVVSMAYYTALSFTFSLILQFITSFFAKNISSITPQSVIFLALVQIFILPVLLFYAQYFPLYNSFRDQKRNKSFLWVQGFTIAIFALELLGIPSTGSVGIIYLFLIKKPQNCSISPTINIVLGVVLLVWHFADLLCEIVIFFKIKSLLRSVQQIP